jgi:2-methylisocitrate lyase-like PEP mutase family enzyme
VLHLSAKRLIGVGVDNAERARRGKHFRELHDSGQILVLPNPWDIGTARIFANLGFQGLATTSAGLAFSLGRRDGDATVSRDETLEHVRTIVDATPLPVTADLENGFGESPETVAETVRLAGEVGLAGASIEDATYRHDDPSSPADWPSNESTPPSKPHGPCPIPSR